MIMLTKSLKTVILLLIVLSFTDLSSAQSIDQRNPTAVTSNEIKGEIKARAIGDSRSTTYYYVFSGKRGDVFINVVTKNLNGTIDLFTFQGSKPRTKITVFADNPESETGRVVYMRESELLVLRIQGRTPNDDAATYLIKFAGSFSPVSAADYDDAAPKVGGDVRGDVRVNSAGTIIEDPNRRKGENKTTVEEKPAVKVSEVAVTEPVRPTDEETKTRVETGDETITKVGDTAANEPKTNAENPEQTDTPGNKAEVVTIEINRAKPKRSALVTISRDRPEPENEPTLEEKLASLSLRVVLKAGGTFLRPMNEVLSVNVIKGVLTVITTDGKIIEFSIFDVEKFTIE